MENKQRFELATKLINERINEELDRWADEPEKLRIYAIRYSEYTDREMSIQPTHGDTFYTIEEYIDIARICRLPFYVDVRKNKDGQPTPTPTLHIYITYNNKISSSINYEKI